MPIVNHNIESSTQADGSSSVILRMYDQDAREFMQGFFAPAGFNLAGKVALVIAELNEQLAQSEFESIVGL